MKIIKIFIFLLISLNVPLKAYSNENIQNILKDGGKIIFIRHAYAPGGGDPINFDISDCSTQRNLNEEGIVQSINIGNFFLKNDIKIDKILSSEWCRCKETAKYAFKKFETKNFLNSFFSQKFANNKNQQIKELKEYVQNWDSKKNLVLVTHYVIILEVTNSTVSSGEMVVTDKNFNVLAQQEISVN
ncbi:MAG: phosphoglycerate mutase [Pelagibacteraceae bacterium BACL20 MAG-120920-bin64]|jgi:phosphohistidine phosphatase SixA|nr:MAG: phosphoglycerate mutase [Pelagibacteraceae bacterium BACL20 MAG-120920-bin64]|tara:strand:- start:812 stop:1372 length:561 start_codon:yes stop_codon:yes gene_type:complete